MKQLEIGCILLMLVISNFGFSQEAEKSFHSCLDSLPFLPGVPIDQYIEKYGLEVSDEVAYDGRQAWVSMHNYHNGFDSISDPYFIETVRIVKSPTDSSTQEVIHFFFLLDFSNLEEVSTFLEVLYRNHYVCLLEMKRFAECPYFGEWHVLKDGYILKFSLVEDPGWYEFSIKVELIEE